MPISARFAEYAMTGAFFWIGQFCAIWAWTRFTGTSVSFAGLASLIDSIPKPLETSTNNLLGALGIIGIFTAGLLLDLFGSFLIFWEMKVFRRHLQRNHAWLKPVIDGNAVYLANDYNDFSSRFGDPWGRAELSRGLVAFKLWSRSGRRAFTDDFKQVFVRFSLIRTYNRLWSFLSSYIAVLSGSSNLGMYFDQVYLWRTSRAISTAMVVFAFEIVILGFILGAQRLATASDVSFLWLMLPSFLQVALMLLSLSITLLSYSRMCFTMFSLAYVTTEKNNPVDGT